MFWPSACTSPYSSVLSMPTRPEAKPTATQHTMSAECNSRSWVYRIYAMQQVNRLHDPETYETNGARDRSSVAQRGGHHGRRHAGLPHLFARRLLPRRGQRGKAVDQSTRRAHATLGKLTFRFENFSAFGDCLCFGA